MSEPDRHYCYACFHGSPALNCVACHVAGRTAAEWRYVENARYRREVVRQDIQNLSGATASGKLSECAWRGENCPWVFRCRTLGCSRVERICAEVLAEQFMPVAAGHYEPIEDEL